MAISELLMNIDLEGNYYLGLLINTAESVFGGIPNTSVWCSNADILTKDMKFIDKIVLSIVTETKGVDLKSKIKSYRDILSIDLSQKIVTTSTPLRIPMLELWTNSDYDDYWLDKDILPVTDERTWFIPHDYYMFKKPILFTNKVCTGIDNVIPTGTVISDSILPYHQFVYTT